jgi:hypothetical protein
MAYPIIPAPYGLKPVSLIGGQVFAGSTRQLPIQYNYGTNIFYGDLVSITRGYVTRMAVTTGAAAASGQSGYGQIGVFLGCSYTNPATKQKTFAQFWPANTLAGDGMAIITDDPDTLFKAAAVTTQGGLVVGSFSRASLGLNIAVSDPVSVSAPSGNINTGDSYIGALAGSGATTAALPLRVVDIVYDTAQATTATLTGGGGTTTLTISGLGAAVPLGAEVGYLAANGQYIGTASWVAASVPAGSTSITLNAQAATINVGGVASTGITIPNGATMVFTQYPEALVKLNFGFHEYYTALGGQTA